MLLLSSLAEHSRQLRAEPRCALLFTGPAEGTNPQTAPRVTLTGLAAPVPEDEVPALKALLETRAKLRDLMSKVDRSEELENLLEQVLKNEGELKSLSRQLGLDKTEG